MSNCPHCQAPIPAPKPGASRPLNFCQACGKSLPVGLGATKSSPAKTLMWSGGPIPGLPIKPGVPSPAAPVAPPAAAPEPVNPVPRADQRRTSTADIGIAPTIVPPPPDSPDAIPANLRLPQKTMVGSGISAPIPGVAAVPPPAPADVEVSMDERLDASAPTENGQPAAEPAASPSPAVSPPEPSASEAVPEWAGKAPSARTVSKMSSGAPRGRNTLLIAGVAGGGLLVVAVAAALLMGGKSHPKPQSAVPKATPAAEPAQPVPTPAAANPAPAAAEPAKIPPAAEAKVVAPTPDKVAVPAEKPQAVEKPVEAVVPAAEKAKPEKKVAPEKVAMAERPAKPAAAPKTNPAPVEKTKPASEPAPTKVAAKATDSWASVGGDKSSLAAEAYQRGNAKLLSGALPEAIAAFSEAIKLNPRDAQSQRGLGLAYAQSGKAPLAVRYLKLYLKTAPAAPDRALIEKRIEQLSGR